MYGREELTLDHAIERAAAAGTLARYEIVSVFLEVLRLAVDSALVPEPSRVVLAEDGSLSFTHPPAPARSISPDAAITSPAIALRLPAWLRFPAELRLPAALRRQPPRWAVVAGAALAGALLTALLQRSSAKHAAPPAVLVSTPV